eukprot:gene4784-15086_t
MFIIYVIRFYVVPDIVRRDNKAATAALLSLLAVSGRYDPFQIVAYGDNETTRVVNFLEEESRRVAGQKPEDYA